MNRFAFAAGVYVLSFLITPAFADEKVSNNDKILIAMGLCSEMEHQVNVLVDYTNTKCLPTLETTGTNFIFISEKPVFSVQASKKAWMLVVVAAVGKALNSNSSYHADKIFFADMTMAKDKNYYTVSAPLAKHLQQDVYDGQISLEEMWDQITSALRPYTVPTK